MRRDCLDKASGVKENPERKEGGFLARVFYGSPTPPRQLVSDKPSQGTTKENKGESNSELRHLAQFRARPHQGTQERFTVLPRALLRIARPPENNGPAHRN